MLRLRRRLLLLLGLLLTLVAIWLGTSDDPRIWPIRNTVQYRLFTAGWQLFGSYPQGSEPGTLHGIVLDEAGQPVAGAWVLASTWRGETFSARSDAEGRYRIEGVPEGRYRPVADAAGFEPTLMGGLWGGVRVVAGAETAGDAILPPQRRAPPPSPAVAALGPPATVRCATPLPREATRRTLTLEPVAGALGDLFLYSPLTTTAQSRLPVLLALYPGPVETWECVSVPLAAAGYSVLSVGPAYNLDLEATIDDLARLAAVAQAGQLPGTDGERLALLGGSYSAILAQRLIERGTRVDASVLLGPPTDLFDARRRYEAGEFQPPFGLDQVLLALGFPDRDPLRYWRYSGAYHVTGDAPPTILFHSRQDDIVPFQQSEQLADAMRAAGVEHSLHLFDGSTHYLLDADAQALEIYDLTLAFLARKLQ